MQKILSAEQIRAWDAHTIHHEPIASIDLMERACRAFVEWFTERFNPHRKVGVVCGTGNNGGDGLGIARLLREWGYPVSVWVVRGGAASTDDFNTNFERLSSLIEIAEIAQAGESLAFDACDVLIDGIFGSGLSRPPAGVFAYVIDEMNKADATRVAIDIPSGLMADAHSSGSITKAHFTVTFQSPKLAFYLPGSHAFTGTWQTVDIGLRADYLDEVKTFAYETQRKDIKRIRRRRSTFDHKGDYGRAVIVAGSYGKMGAAVLAARAALRAGVGLLTVHIPGCGYTVMQTAVPEAMATVDPAEHAIEAIPDLTSADAVGIGPGLGTGTATANTLRLLLESQRAPMVVDADALNIMSAHTGLLQLLPPLSILTPHPREFERLAGSWGNDFQKLDLLRDFVRRNNVIVILKGAYSAIATPDGEVYFNPTGNPGMATGGSGDVLTGILTALLAQGYSPFETGILGTYVHGHAGDLAVVDKGMEALIASDLVDYLPQAFR